MAETIAAIATAPGEGGISIVRVSGDRAEEVLNAVFRPATPGALQDRVLTYGRAVDAAGDTLDGCLAVIMRAPRSYTREDVAELQLHGGTATARRVLQSCLDAGARLAEPGEFTRRAFLNGRIDLSQAEAVMELISARGENQRRAAVRQLEGGSASFIRAAADRLYDIQAGLAACMDYPEEISDEEATDGLAPKLAALAAELEAACDERAAHLIHEGLAVALAGKPNVGKSSLLNALIRRERAIVTDIPGTTRDTVEGEITLGGTLVRLTDTAGLRETDDPVERIGVNHARQALSGADLVLLVLDGSAPLTREDAEAAAAVDPSRAVALLNKADLPPCVSEEDVRALLPVREVLRVCARDEATLQPLRALLAERAAVSDSLALTQPRHIEAAERAVRALKSAGERLAQGAMELAAVDLNEAQHALAEITGDEADERLLDRVFSRFCVGK